MRRLAFVIRPFGQHFRCWWVILVGLAAPSESLAQRPAFTFQSENDAYPSWGDDDYTNGLRLSLDYSRAILWGRWWSRHDDCRNVLAGTAPCRRTTLILGQNFYTPHNITISEVQPDERPYSAWLYIGMAARLATDRRLRSVELQLGTTGRPALGEEVQSWWHARPWVEAPQPMGWAHQVRTVPGLVGVIAMWDDKFAFEAKTGGSDGFVFADAIPYYRLTVGNVHDSVAAGTTVRLGYNLQRRWTEKIGPTVRIASLQGAAASTERRFDFGVFGASETRAVFWNALLQHETYTPRTLRPASRGVVDFEAGMTAGYRGVSGGFRWVWRSPEFDGGRWSRYAGLFFTLGSKIR